MGHAVVVLPKRGDMVIKMDDQVTTLYKVVGVQKGEYKLSELAKHSRDEGYWDITYTERWVTLDELEAIHERTWSLK